MANHLPPTIRLVMDLEGAASGDPARMKASLSRLLQRLTGVYEEIAQVVNENWEKRNEPSP